MKNEFLGADGELLVDIEALENTTDLDDKRKLKNDPITRRNNLFLAAGVILFAIVGTWGGVHLISRGGELVQQNAEATRRALFEGTALPPPMTATPVIEVPEVVSHILAGAPPCTILPVTSSPRVVFSVLQYNDQKNRIPANRRELYILDPYGEAHCRLTNNDVEENHATWSADGQQIAFVASGSIHIMNSDGTNSRELVSGGEPDWSPDGEWVTFVSNGWIHRIRPDGSGKRALVEGRSPEWASDSSDMVYVYNERIFFRDVTPASAFSFDLGALNAEAPSLSPDKKFVAYTTYRGIHTADLRGYAIQQLTNTDLDTDNTPQWVENGARILYTSQRWGGSALVMMRTTGSFARTLVDGAYYVTNPDWWQTP